MSGIQVISKQSHDTIAQAAQNSANIKMTTPSVVLVQEKLENVAEIKKDGLDLIVIMKDGQAIVLEDYFAQGLMQNSLVFEDGAKELVWTQFTDPQNFVDGVVYENINSVNALLDFHIAPPEATPFLYGLGVASLVAGGIVMLSHDGHNNHSSTNSTTTNNVAVANSQLTVQAVQLVEQPEQVVQLNASANESTAQANTTEATATSAETQTANSTTATDSSDTHAANSSDAIYQLLLAAAQPEANVIQSNTFNSDSAVPSFSLADLLSGGSTTSGDVVIANTDSTTTNNDQTTAQQTEQSSTTNFDHFAVNSVSLFDLLSTTWVG